MARLQLNLISMDSFKEFLAGKCSDEHKKMMLNIESEYEKHRLGNKILSPDDDYFENLIGWVDSLDSTEKIREDFLSIFLTFVNDSNQTAIDSKKGDRIVHVLGYDSFAQSSINGANSFKPKQLVDKMSDAEYERGFFQYMNVTSKKTVRSFKKVVKKYNKFITSIDEDVQNMLKHEMIQSSNMDAGSEVKKVFIADNDVPVYNGETYILVKDGIAQMRKCVPSDYVGELGTKRFSISHFISPN